MSTEDKLLDAGVCTTSADELHPATVVSDVTTVVRLAGKGLLVAKRVPGQRAVSFKASGTPEDSAPEEEAPVP